MHRLHGAERTIGPAGGHALLSQPRNLAVELLVGRNVRETSLRGGSVLGRTCVTVEERSHRVTVHRTLRAVGAIRPAGRDALSLHPLNFLVVGVVERDIREARGGRRGVLRRAAHTVEVRSHGRAVHVVQRAEGAVLVAAINLTGSNPRDFTVELVIRRNVGETCIVEGASHLHDLRTVASGNTVSGLTAAQVTGRVVHVQEQSLTLLVVVLAVNGQLTAVTVHEQAGHARLLTGEPNTGVEGGVLDSRGGVHVGVAIVVPGVGLHRVLDALSLLSGQTQVLQRHTQNHGVGVHDVGVGVAPGVVQRVASHHGGCLTGDGPDLHQRVVQTLLTGYLQNVICGGVVVRINLNLYLTAPVHAVPGAPGRNTEEQRTIVRVLARSLQSRSIRGGTHILQVNSLVRRQLQLTGRDTVTDRTQLKRTQQRTVTALVQGRTAQSHRGLLIGDALVINTGRINAHLRDRLRRHVNRLADRLATILRENQATRSARNVLALTGSQSLTGRPILSDLVGAHRRVHGLLQLGRVNTHGHGHVLTLTGTHAHLLRVGVLHTRDGRACFVVQSVGVSLRIGVVQHDFTLNSLNTRIGGVLQHAKRGRNTLGGLRIVRNDLRVHGCASIHHARTHTIHRVLHTLLILDRGGRAVHQRSLNHLRVVILMRLHHQSGNTGNMRGRHRGTGEGNTLITRAHSGRDNLSTRCRKVRLNEAIRTVLTASARGIQIKSVRVRTAARSLVVQVHLNGHRTGCQGLLQVLRRRSSQTQTRNGRITTNANRVALSLTGHHHANTAGSLNVIETHLRTARERQIVLIPLEVNPLTLQSLRLFSSESLASVTVTLRCSNNLAAQLISGCLRIIEVHRIITLQPLQTSLRGRADTVNRLSRTVGVRHRQRRSRIRRATRIGVGVTHTVVVIGVTGSSHSEHTLARHRINHVRLRVVSRGELATERQVHNIGAVREITVTIRVHHGIERLHHNTRIAVATEHTNRQNLSVRSSTWANRHALQLLFRQVLVIATVSRTVRRHTITGGSTRHVRAVTARTETIRAAIQRVIIRLRSRLLSHRRIVVITDQVNAANELITINQARISGRKLRHRLSLQVRIHRTGATKISVRIVNTRVNNRNLHALTRVPRILTSPRGKSLRINLATGVHTLLRDNRRNTLHIRALRQRTNLRSITSNRRTTHRIMRGVHQLRARSSRHRLSLRLHLSCNSLHLRLTVRRRLLTCQNSRGLGLLIRALALELNIHGDLAFSLLQARADTRGSVTGCARSASFDLLGALSVSCRESGGNAESKGKSRTQTGRTDSLHSAAWRMRRCHGILLRIFYFSVMLCALWLCIGDTRRRPHRQTTSECIRR